MHFWKKPIYPLLSTVLALGQSLIHFLDKVTWWHFHSTSKEVIWPKKMLKYSKITVCHQWKRHDQAHHTTQFKQTKQKTFKYKIETNFWILKLLVLTTCLFHKTKWHLETFAIAAKICVRQPLFGRQYTKGVIGAM